MYSWGDEFCGERSGSTCIDIVYDWIVSIVTEVYGLEDICEVNDCYGDGVCDRFCPEPDSDCDDVDFVKVCGCVTSPQGFIGLWAVLGLTWV